MNIVPLNDRILIAENKREETTSSGIIVGDGQGLGESKTGTVLAIGPDVTEVAVGDVVYLMWNKGSIVKIDGAQRVIIKEEDIVAVLDK